MPRPPVTRRLPAWKRQMADQHKSDKDRSVDPTTPRIRRRSEAEETAPTASPEPAPESSVAPAVPAPAPTAPTPAPKGRETREMGPSSRSGEGKAAWEKMEFGDIGATTDDFAALLASSDDALPERRYYEVGDVVEGRVLEVGQSSIFVSLGGGYEAVAQREAYLDESGVPTLSVGDEASFYVLSTRGGITLGKDMGGLHQGIAALEVAQESGVPISGRVAATNKGGYEVEIQGVMAFCPLSQIDVAFTEDPNEHVGKTYLFKVTQVRDGGRSVVLSRSAAIKEEREVRAREVLAKIAPGQQWSGKVTRVADFGAFVDLGGIEGLIHVSELSHAFFDRASDVVKAGDEVQVEVLSIEPGKGDKGPRISLSAKSAQHDPWLNVNERYAVGQKCPGTIVRLAPFGAFVELEPGVEGLIHVSQMSWKRRVTHPSDVVSVGQRVEVEIQDIDLLRKRIGLSMKSATDDPWNLAAETLTPGTEVKGVVESVEEFGAFVRLESGLTALLPKSEMLLARDATVQRKYAKGQEIAARVLRVEVERRRIALTLKSADEIEATPAQTRPASQATPPAPAPDAGLTSGRFGTLGDLLKSRKL